MRGVLLFLGILRGWLPIQKGKPASSVEASFTLTN
jgi:hypothetical protein